ncbi:MAG: tetratricopeptide repeat protein [Candidatus Zixiibacteriota bacterium]|nr:MAG: tetratricopeptide repeat protein [candidate division Zixibacteria bacterium]
MKREMKELLNTNRQSSEANIGGNGGDRLSRQLALFVLVALFLLLSSGCVYFNTFYHARTWYNQAEKTRQRANRDAAAGGEIKLYQDAIKKCSKVISEHPGSSYMDDALFIIGKSYYYLGDFPKAERKFRELLASFPKSKYADESRFFLGKTRFHLENYVLAMEVFKEQVNKTKGNPFRAEAIFLTGETALLENDSAGAVEQYQKFVKEYKNDPKAQEVQFKIGQIQFERQQFGEAAKSFAAAEALAQVEKVRFQARYEQGRSLFLIDSVKAGLAVFEKLAKDNKDSVFQSDIQLRIAEGNYLAGNEREAILLYDDVATRHPRWVQAAEGYYRIGTIVQNDWSDLGLAKSLYDQATKIPSTGKWGQMALTRSSDITKVEKYRAEPSDSSEDIVDVNRFLLAELYRTTLDQSDSALGEYKSLVEDFPGSELAPKALIAIGWLYENQYYDTASAREYYQKILDEYPLSDEYGQAIRLLGLRDTEPDSLYANKLYELAEEQYYDQGNADSAMTLFRRLMEEYPDSRLVPRADFAIAKIELSRFVPKTESADSTYVDSTMILLFKELAEKYPKTPIGVEAARLASGQGVTKAVVAPSDQGKPKTDSTTIPDTTAVFAQVDTLSESQRTEEKLRAEIEATPMITIEEPLTKGDFIYPFSAVGTRIEGRLMLKIKIEFDGKVSDVNFLKGSGNDDIDREVKKALLETYFNPIQFDPSKFPGWFIYNYDIKLPEIYK